MLDVKSKEVVVTKPASSSQADNGKSDMYVGQDEESILLEQPRLNQDESAVPDLSNVDSDDITNEQKIAIQAYIHYLFRSLPIKDDQTFEIIRPYVNVCVTKSTNYITYAKALLLRSKNEINRHKHMERSLAQVQTLID